MAFISCFMFPLYFSNPKSYQKIRATKMFTNSNFLLSSSGFCLLLFLCYISHTLSQLYNSPAKISSAPTSSKAKIPSDTEIFYYGRFAASFYCTTISPDFCKKWKENTTSVKIISNHGANTESIVVYQKESKEIIVAFRGTNGAQDAALDLAALSFPNGKNGVRVSMGFYAAVMSVYGRIVQEVQRILRKDTGVKRIVLSGGSLGGAMASITTYLFSLNEELPEDLELMLITFGQPRTGNVAFAKYMNGLGIKMARVVARADMVPHLPPVSLAGIPLFLDYFVHHMNEIWIDGDKYSEKRTCSKKVLEDPKCSNSLKDKEYNWGDHYLYFQYLRQYYYAEDGQGTNKKAEKESDY